MAKSQGSSLASALEKPAGHPGRFVLMVTGFGSFMTALDSAATFLVIPLVQQDLATTVAGVLLALRPDSLLSGFHLAMAVGVIVALAGLALGALQAAKAGD